MCDRCNKSNYGYHVTEKKWLDNIKAGGLSSVKTRTNSWTAAASGSFAKDRDQRLPEKIAGRVKDLVIRVMRAGAPADAIVNNPQPRLPVMIDVPVTGSTQDNTQLDRELAESVALYCSELGLDTATRPQSPPKKSIGGKHSAKPAPVVRKVDAYEVEKTVTALTTMANLKEHYLNRAAESYEHWRYAIEEKITGTHVYFFVRNHKAVYDKYLTLAGNKDNIVVLRAKLCNLNGHEPDDSEEAAIMTVHTVLPKFLEQSPHVDGFMAPLPMETAFGSNIPLWEEKGTWTPL